MDASPVQDMLADVSVLKNQVPDPRLRMEIARVEGILYAVEMGDEISLMDLDDALEDMSLAADSVSMDPTLKAALNGVHANAMNAVADVMELGEVTVESGHDPDGPGL